MKGLCAVPYTKIKYEGEEDDCDSTKNQNKEGMVPMVVQTASKSKINGKGKVLKFCINQNNRKGDCPKTKINGRKDEYRLNKQHRLK